MIESVLAVTTHLSFSLAVLTLGIKAARKNDVASVIFYSIAMISVDAPHGLPQDRSGSITISIALIATLCSTFAVNLCLYYFLGIAAASNQLQRRLSSLIYSYFVALFFSYTYVFQTLGLHDSISNATTHRMSDAMYFTVITFTTVGYGDIMPISRLCRLFAALAAINGYVLFAFAIAALVPRLLRNAGETKG